MQLAQPSARISRGSPRAPSRASAIAQLKGFATMSKDLEA